MSLALPAHLVAQTVGSARARGGRVLALGNLVAALLCVVLIRREAPEAVLWPASLALLCFIATLLIVFSDHGLLASAAYLVVGSGALYVYSSILLPQVESAEVALFVLALPKIALVVVGAGRRQNLLGGVISLALGWGLAEGIAWVGLQRSALVLPPDHYTASIVVVVAGIAILSGVTSSSQSIPDLNRAARAEQLAALRSGIGRQAGALLHDVVLNDLAAITLAEAGPVRAELRRRLEADLATLVGQEWLPTGESVEPGLRPGSALLAAVEEVRAQGLVVTVSGEQEVLARLDSVQEGAVALAVQQCLVNVLVHAGTGEAELYLSAVDGILTVMVVDGGLGFDPALVAPDRLGVRESVSGRVEAVGGSATVWSSPGNGTSVLLRVPLSAGPEGVGG